MEKLPKEFIIIAVCVVVITLSLFYIGYGYNKKLHDKINNISNIDNHNNNDEHVVIGTDGIKHVIVVIDGCEYIRSEVFDKYTYTHKGNCGNPKHVYTYGK